MKLSAVIITYNEQEMLEECLKSLSFVDEIIVVDSLSTDKTLETARKYNAKIFDDEGNDFSTKRNKGLKESKCEWILYIDADERVTEELSQQITQVINNSDYQAYRLKRKNYYLGKPWPEVEKIERLFLKKSLKKWTGKLHESPEFVGQIAELDGLLLHFSHRNLSSMVRKTNGWSEEEADLRLQSHHPPMSLWRFIRVMGTTFLDYFISKKGFMAGTVGVIESMYQSFSQFITYAKLWEKQKIRK